jgi:putative transposase
MTYNPAIHHRRSIRLKGYDYAKPGFYFITICIHDRKRPLFGEVRHGAMVSTPFGEIAQAQWQAIPSRFPNVTMDEYVIMPNHIHGILQIHPHERPTPVGAPLAGAPNPGVENNPSPMENQNKMGAPNENARGKNDNNGMAGDGLGATARVAPTVSSDSLLPIETMKPVKTVGDMVGAYKSLCVREWLQWIAVNEPGRRLGTVWQRNYWEHIVRDELELGRIREYIRNNPVNWERDRFHEREIYGDKIRESIAVYGEEDWMI